MACCSINVTEIYAGLRPGEEAKTEGFLKSLKFYPVTWEIAKQAVALANDLVLVTGNPKDFPMPELRLYPLP